MVQSEENLTRRVQLVELEILKEVTAICEKHNIRYYLYGGTLLGAVRHKGFIPWDDDIDIAMLREDYQRFLEIAQDELPKHLFLQHYTTDPGYFFMYIKVRDSNTTFLEPEFAHVKMNHGIFIDIFPLDRMPDSEWLQKAEIGVLRLLSRLYVRKRYHYGPKKGLLQRLKILAYSMIPLSDMKIVRLFEWITKKMEGCDGRYLGDLMMCPRSRRVYRKIWFQETRRFEYEGRLYDGPEGADPYLKHYYGDYMQLPPEEKRKPSHNEMCDPDKSYRELLQ